MSFVADMNKFEAALSKNARTAHDQIGIRFFGNIMAATPMDGGVHAGALRANWNTSVGTPNKTFDRSYTTYEAARLDMENTVVENSPDSTLYLTNGLPYAALIEYGVQGGQVPPLTWSEKYASGIKFQKPNGWVRVEAAKGDAIIQEVVNGLPD